MQWTRRTAMQATWIAAIMGLLFAVVAGNAYAQPAMPPDMSASATAMEVQEGDTAIPTKSMLGVLKDGGLLMIQS